MSDCEFTDAQREIIRQARAERKAAQKNGVAHGPVPTKPPVKETPKPLGTPIPPTAERAMTKLRRMLYLQSGKCFFCGEPLKEEDASIEHLLPTSGGGPRNETNEVVCHHSLNETLGNMDLKRKFEFVLRSAGAFKCPRT